MADAEIGVLKPTAGQTAIGYSVTANIDGVRQIVFQHFVGSDETDEQVNVALDRIMGFVDRQRAVYELPELQEELLKLQDEISQYTEDAVTQAEVNHGRAQAELGVQLETLRADRKKFYDETYAAFRASGRQGAFEPKGHAKAQLERFDAGLKQVQEAMAKNDAEREFFVKNTEGNIQRRRDRIALLQEKIATRERVAA